MIDYRYTYTFGNGWTSEARVAPPPVTMLSIASRVAEEYGFTVRELVSEHRDRRVVWARQTAMWRMRQVDKWSTTQIGRFFNRDHTTVIHACRRVEERMAAGLAKAA